MSAARFIFLVGLMVWCAKIAHSAESPAGLCERKDRLYPVFVDKVKGLRFPYPYIYHGVSDKTEVYFQKNCGKVQNDTLDDFFLEYEETCKQACADVSKEFGHRFAVAIECNKVCDAALSRISSDMKNAREQPPAP